MFLSHHVFAWRRPSGLRLVATLLLLQVVAAQWQPTSPALGERQCQTPGARCIPLRDCAVLVRLATVAKLPSREDVVALQRAHCGFVGSHPKVCCGDNLQGLNQGQPLGHSPTPRPPSFPPRPMPSPMRPAPGPAPAPASITPQQLAKLPLDSCGPINADRIIGGNLTLVMELPWMARLGYRQNNYSPNFDYNCGGSLIHKRYVLTAAHCISENTGLVPVSVRLGEHDATTDIDCSLISGERVCAPPPVDVPVDRIIKHKDYEGNLGETRFQNDIALLRLSREVQFTDAIKPICLPVETEERRKDLTGKKVMVAGWGRIANGNRATGSKVLLKVNVPVTPNQECASSYARLSLNLSADKQLCAGATGKDSCSGDSGGPLTFAGDVQGTLRIVQFGVVSFGPSHCATEGTPGVYTRVAHYVPWILNRIDEP